MNTLRRYIKRNRFKVAIASTVIYWGVTLSLLYMAGDLSFQRFSDDPFSALLDITWSIGYYSCILLAIYHKKADEVEILYSHSKNFGKIADYLIDLGFTITRQNPNRCVLKKNRKTFSLDRISITTDGEILQVKGKNKYIGQLS